MELELHKLRERGKYKILSQRGYAVNASPVYPGITPEIE